MNPDGTTRAFGADDDKATINIETAAARGGRAAQIVPDSHVRQAAVWPEAEQLAITNRAAAIS